MANFIKQFHPMKALISVLLGAVLLIFCSREVQQETDSVVAGAPVQVTHPRIMGMTESIDLNANTVFLKKEIVRATFAGFIEKIKKNIGDEVRPGDQLFQIKTKESAANDSSDAALAAEQFSGSINIYAHSIGFLTALNYAPGDFVADGEEIAIISNPSSLSITLNVPYPYVPRMNRHGQCEIFLPDGQRLNASINKVIPTVDPVSQTQTFLLRLNSAANLPENLNVTARLPLRTVKDALVLPLSAILSDETLDNFWVMKLVNDTTAVRFDIVKGIENDSLVQVISPPFSLNDDIISDGGYGLPDTAKVMLSR
jgi:multidrug efflux pump subunit AcrA (membrane-fusion protein)